MRTRDRSWPETDVARQAGPVEDFITRLVVGRLSRADAADLVAVPEGGPDVAALREEAAAIRRNLEEMAADRRWPTTRPQLLAATGRANLRLDEIGAELEHAARENVLAPLVAAENAAEVWEGLDLSRKRAVIKTLMSITLHSPGGRAARVRPGHGRGDLAAARRRLIPAPAPRPRCREPRASGRLPGAGAAQEERERVTLLAGQRRGGSDQPGDVGIQAGLMVIVGVPVVAGALVLLAVHGLGHSGPG